MKRYIKSSTEDARPYCRYTVTITPYKDMFKFTCEDHYWDKSDYCLFKGDKYIDTNYKGLDVDTFAKLHDSDMESGKSYDIYTAGPFGVVLEAKER